ncbi:MAG: invasion associated locus B family protein [Pseudomonadota bacterium]
MAIRTGIYAAAIAAVATLTVFAEPASAQSNESVDAKRDWSIFKQGAGASRQCWIVSQPVTKTADRGGNPVSVKRGDIFLMVSVRPGEQVKNEVSYVSGYPFKPGGSVTMTIGGSKFELFTEGEGAWTDSADSDDKLVAAMRRGANAVLTGQSSRGTQTTDTFSLLGFTAALNEARTLCK